MNNINNRGQLPEERRTSETRYQSLFESARDGILVLDAESHKIVDANPRIGELLGLSRQELLEKGYLHCKDLPLENKAGRLHEIELTSNVYAEGSRRFVQCNVRSITKRRRAEEALDQIAQNAEMLAQIAGKVARIGGWTIQLPERILTWSDENCAIHDVPNGYKPTLEEGIGYFPVECREQVIRFVNDCAEFGTPYDFELPKYTAKGRLIWVRSIGEAMRNEDGEIIGIQGAFQDITVRKQVEAEREKLIEELQSALAEVKALREFLPICSYCKKIRDDENYWSQLENYISKHTHTKFSHGICPECYETEVKPQLERNNKSIADVES